MTNNTNASQSASLTCSKDDNPQCYAAHVIWKTIPAVLFVVGNLGNILSIMVLCRRKIRKYSVASYLLFLALSDMTFLWTSVLRNTLYRGYQIDIKELTVVYCKLNDWGTMTSGAFSTFIVAILTIERTVLTRWPRSNLIRSTPTNVRVVLIVVGVLIGLGNSHLIYGYTTVTETSVTKGTNNDTVVKESSKCVFTSSEYKRFYFSTFHWIVLFVFNIIPVCIIATGNIIIAVTLRQQKNKVQQQPSDISANTGQQNNRSKAATRTLFIVSAFIMITLTPYCIFAIVQYRILDSVNSSQLASLTLAHALVFSLGYCNFSLNFFMYSIGASLFRKEWQALCKSINVRLTSYMVRVRESMC